MLDRHKTPVRGDAIETERLLLRVHALGDFEPFHTMWSDPGVVRFIGGRVNTRDEVWARLLRYIGHWAALGYGLWAIEEKATGAFIGDLGFADFKRGLPGDFGSSPEMGWTLMPAAQGKGYASEALGAALAWGEANFEARRYVCMIAPENAPSLKLAQKHGFREYDRTDYKGSTSVLLERVRP